MAFVITDLCAGTKNAGCVKVCPCDCIHPRPDETDFSQVVQLYIDPDDCIDCGLCVDECPVKAIFQQDDLPADKVHFARINAEWYERKLLGK